MKIKLHDQEFQLRLQERQVVRADLLQHGEVVATGEAIFHPTDSYDEDKAENIALGRALKSLGYSGHAQAQRDIMGKRRATKKAKEAAIVNGFYAYRQELARLRAQRSPGGKPQDESQDVKDMYPSPMPAWPPVGVPVTNGGAYSHGSDWRSQPALTFDGGDFIPAPWIYSRWERFQNWLADHISRYI